MFFEVFQRRCSNNTGESQQVFLKSLYMLPNFEPTIRVHVRRLNDDSLLASIVPKPEINKTAARYDLYFEWEAEGGGARG